MKNNNIKLILLIAVGILISSCSNDVEENLDTIAPTISIESPEVNQNYVGYWGGAWPEADKVFIKAIGTDETKIAFMHLKVLDNNGTIVFEKTVNSSANMQTKLIISESFTPSKTETYSVIISATDANGNIQNSDPRFFIVE